MPTVLVDGLNIHYHLVADFDPTLPTLLFIHGAGQNISTWSKQLGHLKSTRINIIALDLPGHGQSEGTGKRTVEQYTEFLTDFIHALNLEKLILVGHSMGGAVAITYGLQSADRVMALVLVGTGAKLAVARETLSAIKEDYYTFTEASAERMFGSTSYRTLRNWFRDGLRSIPPAVTYNDLLACNDFDLRDRVGEVTSPTMIISATRDQLTPLKYGEFLHDEIKGSHLHVMRGAGHFMMQEMPEEFNGLLDEFIEQLLAD